MSVRIFVFVAVAIVSFFSGWNLNMCDRHSGQENSDKTGELVNFDEVKQKLVEGKKSYVSFFNRATLHCGIYHLKAGAKDGQSPHSEDEVYYVESGKAKLQVDGEDFECKPGSVLFVAADAKHHFHTIEEDLTLLVFFSRADAK